MTTLPPFAVPRGMDWDPVKKRFFKKLPSQAKVESIHLSISQKVQRDIVAEQSEFAPLSSSIAVKRSQNPRVKSTFPNGLSGSHLFTQHRRRAAVLTTLGQAKHVSTTRIIPWAQQGQEDIGTFQFSKPNIGINKLHSMPSQGSLMFFSNSEGYPFSLDTSHVSHLEPSSAKSITFSLLSTNAYEIDNQIDDRMLSDHLLFYAKEDRPETASAFSDDYIATVWNSAMMIGHLSSKSKCEKLPRFGHKSIIKLKEEKKKKKKKKEKNHYHNLCVRRFHCQDSERVMFAYTTLRRLCVTKFKSTEKPGTKSKDMKSVREHVYAYQSMESDITALHIVPSGLILLIGLRNGSILWYSTQDYLDAKSPTGKNISAAIGKLLPAYGKGAVTHIQAISDSEIIIAYTSGEMFLIDPISRGDPIVRFHGHINSWSLDLPMTVEIPHRLLAVAGQDRRVRIWSLDHPLPLHYTTNTLHQERVDQPVFDLFHDELCTKTLQETTFSAPVTALAFCQRRYMANMETKAFMSPLPRGLPALAVSCGNEIGFFE